MTSILPQVSMFTLPHTLLQRPGLVSLNTSGLVLVLREGVGCAFSFCSFLQDFEVEGEGIAWSGDLGGEVGEE